MIHINKRLKVKSSVIDQYKELCPLSYSKCDSLTDVEYKIKRAATLGTHIATFDEAKHIQYYNLCFVVKENKIIHMYQNPDKYIEVRESVKWAYDRLEGKVLV